MRIIDKPLLRKFAQPGPCEFCGKWCIKREAHHLWTRGSGRLDIPINLISLGSTRLRQCWCHTSAAQIGRDAFLAIVAKREKTTPEAIETEILRLRRLPQPRGVEREKPARKKRAKTAWQIKAGKLRRARNRATYRRLKALRKTKLLISD